MVPLHQSSDLSHFDDGDEAAPAGSDPAQQRELRALAQQLQAALSQLQQTNAQLERQEQQLAAASAMVKSSQRSSASSSAPPRGDVNFFFSCSRYAGLSVAFVFLALFFASIHMPTLIAK